MAAAWVLSCQARYGRQSSTVHPACVIRQLVEISHALSIYEPTAVVRLSTFSRVAGSIILSSPRATSKCAKNFLPRSLYLIASSLSLDRPAYSVESPCSTPHTRSLPQSVVSVGWFHRLWHFSRTQSARSVAIKVKVKLAARKPSAISFFQESVALHLPSAFSRSFTASASGGRGALA
jgi:hypothetical protein